MANDSTLTGGAPLSTNRGFQFSIRYVLLLTFHAALLAAIFMFEVKTVPRYVAKYLEYKLMLPAATSLVIHISMLFLQYWYVIIPPLFLVNGSILLWLDRRRAAWALCWTGIVVFATAVYIGASYVALQRPFNIESSFGQSYLVLQSPFESEEHSSW